MIVGVYSHSGRQQKLIRPLKTAGVESRLVSAASLLLGAGVVGESDVLMTDVFGYAPALMRVGGRKLGVPYVIRLRGDYWSETDPQNPKTHLEARLGEWGLSGARMVLPVSNYLKGIIDSRFPGLASKVRVVNAPVDCDKFKPGLSSAVFNEQFGIEPESRIILAVTNFNYRAKVEGLLYFLPAISRVAARHEKLLVLVAGQGKYLGLFLRELRRRNERRIRCLGYVSQLQNAFSAAEFAIHLSFLDAFPTAVIEAQAVGKPVIVNQVGGVGEMVQEGQTGFIVGKSDLGRFESLLETMVNQPDSRERMGLNARRFVESHFSHNVIGARLKALLCEAVSESASRVNTDLK